MRIFRFNLATGTASKKHWKTYNGAMRCRDRKPSEIVTTACGVDWCKRHPEWCAERLAKNDLKSVSAIKKFGVDDE